MNTQYLGDALDFWKGALISHLIENKALQNMMVDPMITNDIPWKQGGAERSLYAKSLSVNS